MELLETFPSPGCQAPLGTLRDHPLRSRMGRSTPSTTHGCPWQGWGGTTAPRRLGWVQVCAGLAAGGLRAAAAPPGSPGPGGS